MLKYFGTDGVRGVANAGLTPEMAFKLGRDGGYILTKHKRFCWRRSRYAKTSNRDCCTNIYSTHFCFPTFIVGCQEIRRSLTKCRAAATDRRCPLWVTSGHSLP